MFCFRTPASDDRLGLTIDSLAFFSIATDGLVLTELRRLFKVGVDVLATTDRVGLKFGFARGLLGVQTSFSVTIVEAYMHISKITYYTVLLPQGKTHLFVLKKLG